MKKRKEEGEMYYNQRQKQEEQMRQKHKTENSVVHGNVESKKGKMKVRGMYSDAKR